MLSTYLVSFQQCQANLFYGCGRNSDRLESIASLSSTLAIPHHKCQFHLPLCFLPLLHLLPPLLCVLSHTEATPPLPLCSHRHACGCTYMHTLGSGLSCAYYLAAWYFHSLTVIPLRHVNNYKMFHGLNTPPFI